MIQPYKNNARTAGIIFLVINLVALLLARQYFWLWLYANPLGKLFWLAITISSFVWYYNFARAKGYTGWLSLLGLMHFIGFIILLILPDKNKSKN